MTLVAANHFEVGGNGISGVIDTAGPTGTPVVSLELGGNQLEDGTLETTAFGLVATATVEAVPDLHTVVLHVVVPKVNLDGSPVPFPGLGILVTSRTSIGGPGLVDGPLQFHELRALAGLASSVQS